MPYINATKQIRHGPIWVLFFGARDLLTGLCRNLTIRKELNENRYHIQPKILECLPLDKVDISSNSANLTFLLSE